MIKPSLYERLGGEAAVDVAVDMFYDKVLADPLVNVFFKKTDMKKQRSHQKKFMTMAFGGPKLYSGANMRDAHKNMGLKDEHFDAIVKYLGDTLTELGVDTPTIKEVIGVVETTRNDVLDR